MNLLGEDDVYYYIESETNGFGTYVIGVESEAEEYIAESESSESEGSGGASLAPWNKEESNFLMILLFVLLGIVILMTVVTIIVVLVRTSEPAHVDKKRMLIKYFAYKNLDNQELDSALARLGLDNVTASALKKRVTNLKRGELENFLYKALSEGYGEEYLVQHLVKNGWKKHDVKWTIKKFKEI